MRSWAYENENAPPVQVVPQPKTDRQQRAELRALSRAPESLRNRGAQDADGEQQALRSVREVSKEGGEEVPDEEVSVKRKKKKVVEVVEEEGEEESVEPRVARKDRENVHQPNRQNDDTQSHARSRRPKQQAPDPDSNQGEANGNQSGGAHLKANEGPAAAEVPDSAKGTQASSKQSAKKAAEKAVPAKSTSSQAKSKQQVPDTNPT